MMRKLVLAALLLVLPGVAAAQNAPAISAKTPPTAGASCPANYPSIVISFTTGRMLACVDQGGGTWQWEYLPAGGGGGAFPVICAGTDDTAAFQAAIDLAEANGGTVEVADNTTCVITGSLEVTAQNVTIQGSGSGSLIQCTAEDGACIKVDISDTNPPFILRNLTIQQTVNDLVAGTCDTTCDNILGVDDSEDQQCTADAECRPAVVDIQSAMPLIENVWIDCRDGDGRCGNGVGLRIREANYASIDNLRIQGYDGAGLAGHVGVCAELGHSLTANRGNVTWRGGVLTRCATAIELGRYSTTTAYNSIHLDSVKIVGEAPTDTTAQPTPGTIGVRAYTPVYALSMTNMHIERMEQPVYLEGVTSGILQTSEITQWMNTSTDTAAVLLDDSNGWVVQGNIFSNNAAGTCSVTTTTECDEGEDGDCYYCNAAPTTVCAIDDDCEGEDTCNTTETCVTRYVTAIRTTGSDAKLNVFQSNREAVNVGDLYDIDDTGAMSMLISQTEGFRLQDAANEPVIKLAGQFDPAVDPTCSSSACDSGPWAGNTCSADSDCLMCRTSVCYAGVRTGQACDSEDDCPVEAAITWRTVTDYPFVRLDRDLVLNGSNHGLHLPSTGGTIFFNSADGGTSDRYITGDGGTIKLSTDANMVLLAPDNDGNDTGVVRITAADGATTTTEYEFIENGYMKVYGTSESDYTQLSFAETTANRTYLVSDVGADASVGLLTGSLAENYCVIQGAASGQLVSTGSDCMGFGYIVSALNGTLSGESLLTAGNGIDVTVAASAATVDVDILGEEDGAGSTANYSGMEFGSDDGLALLQGCADGEILKWDDESGGDGQWKCSADSGGSGSWTDEASGNTTHPGTATVDWIRVAGADTAVAIGHAAGPKMSFDVSGSVGGGNDPTEDFSVSISTDTITFDRSDADEVTFSFANNAAGTAVVSSDKFDVPGSSTQAGRLILKEDTDNGTDTVGIKSPDSVSAARLHELPDLTDSTVAVIAGSQTFTDKVIAGESNTISQMIDDDCVDQTGVQAQLCFSTSDEQIYVCPNANCSGSGWVVASGSGSVAWHQIGNGTSNGDVAMANTIQSLDWGTGDSAQFKITLDNDNAGVRTTPFVLFQQSAASSGASTAYAFVAIDNADLATKVFKGLAVTSEAGGIDTALDASDAQIDTALAIGANDITTGTATISAAELSLLDGQTDLEEETHCTEHDSADLDCSGETLVIAADSVDATELTDTLALDAGLTVTAANVAYTPILKLSSTVSDITSAVTSLHIEAYDADDTDWTPLTIVEDADGTPATIFTVDKDGLITTASVNASSIVADSVGEASLADADFGDFTCNDATTKCAIDTDAVALGTDTTGNYASSASEGGAADDLACTDCVAATDLADADFGDFACNDGTGGCLIGSDKVALSTDTTGNYVATVADDGTGTITVTGSGSEGAAVTLKAVDVSCTGCLGTTEIDGTLTSADLADALDFGGDTSIEIPNGTGPTVDANGEIATDSTSDQLLYYSDAVRVVSYLHTMCVKIENLAAADDDYGFYSPGEDITLVSAYCHCEGTCTTEADVALEVRQIGTASTVDAVTGTVDCEDLVTGDSATGLSGTGSTVDALDLIRFDVSNTPSPETDEYTICLTYTVDPK